MKAVVLAARDEPFFCGESMQRYVVDTLRLSGAEQVIVASGEMQISPEEEVIVVDGQAVFLTEHAVARLWQMHASLTAGATGATAAFAVLRNISGCAGIVRLGSRLMRITDDTERTQEVLAGLCIVTGEYLDGAADVIGILKKVKNLGRPVELCEIPAAEDIVAQSAELARLMRRRINLGHMRAGVSIIDPGNTYIGYDVTIGAGTTIYPGAILEGRTEIGAKCVVGANTRLVNVRLGEGAEVWQSVAFDSEIGDFTKVGPFAYIRPGSVIGRRVKIGDFVEIKNSGIGDDTKVSHLTYIGDADVGSAVNFGCGTVTVNYDGLKKQRAVINDNAFIGCNTNLISPVTIGNAAYIAAGSTITGDVPDGALSIARARQVDLPDRAARYLNRNG